MNLQEFLQKNPWPEAWTREDKPLDYFWSVELPIDVRRLWPVLIDTSALNKRLGLPEMSFVEKGGRLQGTSVNLGMRLEWEETPWEWEYGKELRTCRVYRRGFARQVRVHYLLEEPAPGRTLMRVYFGWIPRGFRGAMLLRASMPWLRRRYDTALAEIARELSRPSETVNRVSTALPPEGEILLALAEKELLGEKLSPDLVKRVIRHIRSAPDAEVLRLRPRALARRWQVLERPLLSVFLHATRKGLVRLSWDLICPHCRGVRAELTGLGDVPKSAECEACQIDFSATGLNSLEATFRVQPAVRKVAPKLYCAAEPATKPHILFQTSVPAAATRELRTLIDAGRYRLRVQGRKDYRLLDVSPSALQARVEWSEDGPPLDYAARPCPVLALRNASAEPRVFVVEEAAIDADALRPVDLFSFQDFRDLFSDQALPHDIELEIGVQTVLFTDLVDSTRFYHDVGDAQAFVKVREHFVRIFEVLRGNGGAVVKTIGDSAMGGFERPADALRAAADLQRHFSGANPLRIRVSVNTGPCLAVNFNSNIDYFGSTVNLAAKLQSLAGANQIVFPEELRKDPGVSQFLSQGAYPLETLEFPLSWTDGQVIRVQRFAVG